MVLVEQEAPFRVRNFGNDRDYDSLEALLTGLRSDYRGLSVAVHVRRPATGMMKTFFVDVRPNGDIVESYGERPYSPVDITLLKEAAGAVAA